MERFAIVQWEDKLSSIVNLDKVKFPRKPVSEYKEGDYVVALYGKQAYKARISEISGKFRPTPPISINMAKMI